MKKAKKWYRKMRFLADPKEMRFVRKFLKKRRYRTMYLMDRGPVARLF